MRYDGESDDFGTDTCWQCGKPAPLADHSPDDRYTHSRRYHLRCADATAWVDMVRHGHEDIDAQSMRNVRNALTTVRVPTFDQARAAQELTEWLTEKGLT